MAVDRFPGAVPLWKVFASGADSSKPKHSVEYQAVILRSIPVTRKECQLKKEEPHDKIEMHLARCNNPIKPEVHHELYTESQDCASHRKHFSCGSGHWK